MWGCLVHPHSYWGDLASRSSQQQKSGSKGANSNTHTLLTRTCKPLHILRHMPIYTHCHIFTQSHSFSHLHTMQLLHVTHMHTLIDTLSHTHTHTLTLTHSSLSLCTSHGCSFTSETYTLHPNPALPGSLTWTAPALLFVDNVKPGCHCTWCIYLFRPFVLQDW